MTRYRNSVGGSNRVRQQFTVQDATRNVDGLWLSFGHLPTADGSSMQVTLKNSSGAVLATSRMGASQQCIKTVPLVKGSTYSVELSAGASAGFLFGAQGMVSDWANRNTWTKAGAQYSKNNGSSWSKWSGQSGGADAKPSIHNTRHAQAASLS